MAWSVSATRMREKSPEGTIAKTEPLTLTHTDNGWDQQQWGAESEPPWKRTLELLETRKRVSEGTRTLSHKSTVPVLTTYTRNLQPPRRINVRSGFTNKSQEQTVAGECPSAGTRCTAPRVCVETAGLKQRAGQCLPGAAVGEG